MADSVNSVISSRRYTPPHAPCEPELCVFSLRAVFFLSCVLAVDLFFMTVFFLLFLLFFSISIWTSFVSFCLFLAGILLSPRFRVLLRLNYSYSIIAHLTSLFLSEVYDFVSYYVYYLLFYFFPS